MCLPLPQRFDKTKNFFECICRQLRYHQHGIRSKIGISLQIIQQHIHQKDLKLCLHHVTMPRLLLNWKKHKQEIQLCYDGAFFFLTAIWQSHGQLWAILKGTASLTRY